MLIPQNVPCETPGRQGGRLVTLDELRLCLAQPARLTDQHRQRLLQLVRKLDRIRALGDEYAGICLSDEAATVLRKAQA